MSTALVLQPHDLDRILLENREILLKEIAKIKKESVEVPLTRDEAAKYLKVHVDTLDKWLKTGTLDPKKFIHRVGGRPYFFASELESYIKKS